MIIVTCYLFSQLKIEKHWREEECGQAMSNVVCQLLSQDTNTLLVDLGAAIRSSQELVLGAV